MTKPINIDADPRNSDWAKTRTWDIWTPGYTKLVDTRAELEASIAPMTLEHFLTLPAAEAMPAKLRKELEADGLLVAGDTET